MPEPPPPPNKPAPAEIAWARVTQYADKLFDSIEALDEAGGIESAAESAKWTPKARKRAEALLKATRDAIDGELAQLESGRRERSGR